jgi:hypothetical protein
MHWTTDFLVFFRQDSIQGKHFHHIQDVATWPEAREHCSRLGGDLASIANLVEDNQVVRVLAGFSIWIGLNDRGSEGSFQWADGQSGTANLDRAVYTSEATGGHAENCVLMKIGSVGEEVRWEDTPCGDTHGFLCSVCENSGCNQVANIFLP